MLRFLLRRALLAMPGLVGVLAIGFLLMQMAPIDPAGPLVVRFGSYLSRLAQGDLGVSLINDMPVAVALGRTIGPTVELMMAACVWSVPLGIFAGAAAAARRGGVFDRAVVAASMAGLSAPVFFVAFLLIWCVGFRWHILPVSGRGGALWTGPGLASVVLPAVTLGAGLAGPVARIVRMAVLDAMRAEHVRTARALGFGEIRVLVAHAWRVALSPVVASMAVSAGFLLGGVVVTETIFAWPGVGRLAVGAVLSGDFPMVQGTILVLALGYFCTNLCAVVTQGLLDPRIRLE